MIAVKFTNGFGNNLFQYIAARQLAAHHEQELIGVCDKDYYAQPDLEALGISFSQFTTPDDTIFVNDNNYLQCFSNNFKDKNFIVNGYFENYKYYIDNLNEIRKWFPPIEKRKDNDLVIHFRAGDRLFINSKFDHKVSPESYLTAIECFDFDNLYIVTDMPKWDHISGPELEKIKFHRGVRQGYEQKAEVGAAYFNSFIEAFAKFNPIVQKCGILEDFNFIRTFDNILFQHGTLGWWAAVLSDARKVGVYGPWRPWKKDTNKNLSQIALDGWFQWE